MLLHINTLLKVKEVLIEEKLYSSGERESEFQYPQIGISICAKLYTSLYHFRKESGESFDENEQKMKGNLPYVHKKSVNKRKRVKNQQVSDGDAPNYDERLSPRAKFRVKCFIPVSIHFKST
jgi:hypothetical protein